VFKGLILIGLTVRVGPTRIKDLEVDVSILKWGPRVLKIYTFMSKC
jgi:hypothetical protein